MVQLQSIHMENKILSVEKKQKQTINIAATNNLSGVS